MKGNKLYSNDIAISGISTLLTTSHKKNFHIISEHWKTFNNTIYKFGLRQSASWKKYGVTIKENDTYKYISGIPHVLDTPLDSFTIPKGLFMIYEHNGALNKISSTINRIYKDESILRALDTNRSLIHYELYDRRFKWNSEDSIIELRIPLMKSVSEELC